MSTTVMTGGTSGFGTIAAERIAGADRIRLVHGARHAASTGEVLPLDLSSLDSVRAFAATVRERGDPIDGLVLNAGMIRSDVAARTVDGFETTFAVNHLAHYLLLRLLLPALGDRALVVATTSGTHDPATGAGLVPPRHADAGLLAHPERDPDLDTHPRKAGQHAYTASKLCTVLTMRRLSKDDAVRAGRIPRSPSIPARSSAPVWHEHSPLRCGWRGASSGRGPACSSVSCRTPSTRRPKPGTRSQTSFSVTSTFRTAGVISHCAAANRRGRNRRCSLAATSRQNGCGARAHDSSDCPTTRSAVVGIRRP
ncbi:SDR family NAD(P)-dependent oxidoreductase [Rhodococcus rhodochrous]|nr:SDR family NAD(P)-dependent oxidoreductase [Rhodococcus rhodochrous]